MSVGQIDVVVTGCMFDSDPGFASRGPNFPLVSSTQRGELIGLVCRHQWIDDVIELAGKDLLELV